MLLPDDDDIGAKEIDQKRVFSGFSLGRETACSSNAAPVCFYPEDYGSRSGCFRLANGITAFNNLPGIRYDTAVQQGFHTSDKLEYDFWRMGIPIYYEITIYAVKNDRYVMLSQFSAEADLTKKRIEGPRSSGLIGGNFSITAAIHGKEILAQNCIPEIGTTIVFDNRYHQITLDNCVIQHSNNNAYIYSERVKEVVKNM